MKTIRFWGKALLCLHLFACCVWLVFCSSVMHGKPDPNYLPEWVFHIVLWSLLGVQVTWGFTVGFLVGPNRKRRDMLWWSLLTVFFPLWPAGFIIRGIYEESGVFLALLYTALFAAILASETYCGVLLGAKAHAGLTKED